MPLRPLHPLCTLLAFAWLSSVACAAPQFVPQRQVQTARYDALGRLERLTYDGKTTAAFDYDDGGRISIKRVTPRPPGEGGGGGGGGCFIATAAFGSPLEPEVQSLRDFRDAHLRTNAPGRAFVAWYERTSPPLAAWIGERPWARATARLGLAPLLLAAGHPRTAAIVAPLLLALLVVGVRRWRRSAARRSLARLATAAIDGGPTVTP